MRSAVEATRRTGLVFLVAGCVLTATGSVLAASLIAAPGGSGPVAGPLAPTPGPGTSPPEAPPSTSPGPIAPPPMRLALVLRTDRPDYTIGDTVHVTTYLTNVGNGTVVLNLPNPCSVVFLAYDAAGDVVFNSTSPCIQVTMTLHLAPGASEPFRFDWDLIMYNGSRVPAPADYRLVPMFFWGRLYQDSVVRTDSATIHVDARTIA